MVVVGSTGNVWLTSHEELVWDMLVNEPIELLGYHVGPQQTVGANEQLAMASYEIHSQQLSVKDRFRI